MNTLEIRLADDLRARLAARAAESGYTSLEAYVEAMLRADAGEEQAFDDDELEQLLLRRLDRGEGMELTPALVSQFKQEVAERRRARIAKSSAGGVCGCDVTY